MDKKADLAKLINLLLEYEEKLENSINKKYKPFVRSIVNLEALTKNIKPEELKVKRQLIVFKLGLESKAIKCVILSLQYLLRLFEAGFVGFNDPNYSEHYVIGENDIKEQEVPAYTQTAGQMLKRVVCELIHFKNDEANTLIAKILEYFIGDDILSTILALSIKPPPNYSTLLYSYLTYRFYLYEQCYFYTQKELERINFEVPKDERLNKMITAALERNSNLEGFVSMYTGEIVDKIVQDGGKYGHCVICKQKADFHCRDTKVSLCGQECKAKHLDISNKFQEDIFRANSIYEQILNSLDEVLAFVGRESAEIKNKSIIFEILNTILKKPFLFFLIKPQITSLLKKYMPNVISKLLTFKQNYYTQLGFSLMCSLVKYFKSSFTDQTQLFFSTEVLLTFEQKKPRYDLLLINYAFLAQIVSNGRHILELYINLDCKLNRDNTIERVMYELGKILQDRFQSANYLSKHERNVLKGQCLQIHRVLFNSLSEYKKNNPDILSIESILLQKNKKVNIQKFVFKFNESWSAGLKALYNLNLISLDDIQLIGILSTTAKLKKTEIQLYLMDQARRELLHLYLDSLKMSGKQLIPTILEYYRIFPVRQGGLPHKLFAEHYLISNPNCQNLEETLDFLFKMLAKDLKKFTVTDLTEAFRIKHMQVTQQSVVLIYKMIWELQKPLTSGKHQDKFIYCHSKQSLEVMGSQLNLLQISISHLLQNSYELQKTLELALRLQTICSSANIFTLLIKSTNFEYVASGSLQPQHIQIIKFLLDIPETIPDNVPDWLPLLRFYNDMYYFSLSACLTPVLLANKAMIVNSINVQNVEVNLIRIGSQIGLNNYSKFMLAMLKIGAMQSQYDRTLMLQKFFQIFEMNIPKSIHCWSELFPRISTTCLNNCFNLHSQIGIYTVDLVKQNFLKLLQANLEKELQVKYLELFQDVYTNAKHQEVKEFVISCLAVVVENHFELCESSWKIVLNLFAEALNLESATVREIIDAVLDKIMSENLRYLLNFYEQIIAIMVRMVTPHEHKIAIKTLVNIRVLIDFLIKQAGGSKAPLAPIDSLRKQKCRDLAQKLMPVILMKAADKMLYDSHDTLFEVFFVLIKRNTQQEQPIMSPSTTNAVYDRMYGAIIQVCKKNDPHAVMIAEKFISYNVGWEARLKHFYSLECMSRCIIGQYNNLSMIAIKGFKSFIQVLNPQTESEWNHFTTILLKIISDCRISNIEAIQKTSASIGPSKDMLELITHSRGIRDLGDPIDADYLTNQLIVQKLCVELLPNDNQCLRILLEIYNEVSEFNENIQLRCILWKKGLGMGCPELPSLILLEEKVINRILSIYNCSKDYQNFYEFAIDMLTKYCSISRKLGTVESMQGKEDWDNIQFELITVYSKHLNQRKQLLCKIVGYLLPKLVDTDMNAHTALRLGNTVIDLLEFSETKDIQIKLLRNLAESA